MIKDIFVPQIFVYICFPSAFPQQRGRKNKKSHFRCYIDDFRNLTSVYLTGVASLPEEQQQLNYPYAILTPSNGLTIR